MADSSSSASERSRSPSPARAVTRPKSSRTFVWLRELPKAIPRGKPWDQLNRDGRVREIEFGKNFTEKQMRDLVRENFTELGEADFRRIRLYKSGSRGSVLKRVAKNMPCASTLLGKFSGGSSKRVYILLKSDDGNIASRAAESTKASTNSRSLSSSGFFGTPFYSEGTKVGTVAGDMSPHGLGEESDLPSRTNEVVRCEERLLASCRGENTFLPSFLIHSFDELCWQARTLTMVLCIVLLNPRRENAGVREGIVRALRWLSAQSQGKGVLYWPAETSSTDGKRVCNMFAVRYPSDALILIVPSSSSLWKPTLLDEIDESSITATNVEDRLATALEKATDLLKVLSTQREKIENFRKDRAEQEEDLLREQQKNKKERKEGEDKEKENVEEEQNKEEDNDNQEKDAVRSARKARVNVEPAMGNLIRVRSQNETRQRRFQSGAHFQEVYDWLGASESFPPYFTLHRGSMLVSHEETIERDETINVTEREEGEMESFFQNKVSFKGNFNYQESLHETLEDPVNSRAENEDESSEEKEKEKNGREKRKRKRKKDVNRTTAKRLKKKKEKKL